MAVLPLMERGLRKLTGGTHLLISRFKTSVLHGMAGLEREDGLPIFSFFHFPGNIEGEIGGEILWQTMWW